MSITTVQQAIHRLDELWAGEHNDITCAEYYGILEVWYDRIVAHGYQQACEFNELHHADTVQQELAQLMAAGECV